MRRYAFYFAVALLAFGIGSFVVVKFSRKIEPHPIVSEIVKEKKVEIPKTVPFFVEEKTEIPKQKVRFKCTDKILSAVWKKIKSSDFADWENAALADSKDNCSDIIYVMEKVDLNGDGVKEIIVGGKHWLVNGATGNCGIWICQKSGKNYKVIFEDSAEDYEIKKSRTNGYRDVFLKFHASCCSSYQTTHKFKRGKYRESQCSFVDYGTTGVKSVSSCIEEN